MCSVRFMVRCRQVTSRQALQCMAMKSSGRFESESPGSSDYRVLQWPIQSPSPSELMIFGWFPQEDVVGAWQGRSQRVLRAFPEAAELPTGAGWGRVAPRSLCSVLFRSVSATDCRRRHPMASRLPPEVISLVADRESFRQLHRQPSGDKLPPPSQCAPSPAPSSRTPCTRAAPHPTHACHASAVAAVGPRSPLSRVEWRLPQNSPSPRHSTPTSRQPPAVGASETSTARARREANATRREASAARRKECV